MRIGMEGIPTAYLFNTLWGGLHCVSDRVTCEGVILKDVICVASELKQPLFVRLRKGLRIKFSDCLSAALYAAFRARLKQGRVTKCHSVAGFSCTGHH